MSRELDYYQLVVKPSRFNDWKVYNRKSEMNLATAQTKSDAIKKAKANAYQWLKVQDNRKVVGIEKRTKTGKKSYEEVRL